MKSTFTFFRILALLLATTVTSISSGTTHTVSVSDFSFSPASFNALVGDTVRWVWVSGSHTTTSTSVPSGAAGWDSPITSSNPSFSYKITTAGSYAYHCVPHAPSMAGSFVAALPTGITSFSTEKFKAIAFPNPFKQTLSVHAPQQIEEVVLYDALGKVCLRRSMDIPVSQLSFDPDELSSLSEGLYFIEISDANRNRTSLRLVKSK